MKPNHLMRLIGYTTMSLLLHGGFSVSRADVQFAYDKVKISYQTVKVRKADGSIFSAEFLSEMILLPDGRAKGGFGMWELSGPNVLSLYHVIEGRRHGPFFTFKAQRLSPLPAQEITVTLRPVPGEPPTGSVRFLIDGVEPLSFTAKGKLSEGCVGGRRCDDALPEFGFIRADPQTVLVQTFAGNYTANFENVALVFSGGRAIGSLALSGPDGPLQNIRILSGDIFFRNGESIVAWLRGRTADSPRPVLMVIANEDLPSEPCRIYDILGTQGPVRFEAQGRITALMSELPVPRGQYQ